MIVTPFTKTADSLMQELATMFDLLNNIIKGRPLKDKYEGKEGKGMWAQPQLRTAIEKERIYPWI